jgi:hypothetical protein
MEALGVAAAKYLYPMFHARPDEALSMFWIGGLEDGEPVLGASRFTYEIDPAAAGGGRLRGNWSTTRSGLPREPDGTILHVASVLPDGPAMTLWRTSPRPAWFDGSGGAVQRLIEQEIAAAPSRVAPPVFVTEITREGVRFVENQKEQTSC